MTPSRRRLAVAVAIAVALFGGGLLAGRYIVPDEPAASSGPSAPPGEPSPSPADIGFSQDMATHHAQAIRMAASVRGRVSPEADAVAAQVFETQVQESGVLRGWLQLWDAPQLPSGPPMMWMADYHETHSDGGPDGGDVDHGDPAATSAAPEESPMPGMASQDEVNRLEDLSGAELEASFMQLMVRHHQGGVLMAQAAAELAEVPAVRSLAAGMALQQQQEITLMQQLLGERE